MTGSAVVMVKVSNAMTDDSILLEKFTFVQQYFLMRDHYRGLKMAFTGQ